MNIIIKVIITAAIMIAIGGLLMFIKRHEADSYYIHPLWFIGLAICIMGAFGLLLLDFGLWLTWLFDWSVM